MALSTNYSFQLFMEIILPPQILLNVSNKLFHFQTIITQNENTETKTVPIIIQTLYLAIGILIDGGQETDRLDKSIKKQTNSFCIFCSENTNTSQK